MKVVGVQHQIGTFNNLPYDNYRIYTIDESRQDPNMVFGVCPMVTKVKASVLHQVVASDKIQKLIDRNVMFYFDAYKNVVKVEVL